MTRQFDHGSPEDNHGTGSGEHSTTPGPAWSNVLPFPGAEQPSAESESVAEREAVEAPDEDSGEPSADLAVDTERRPERRRGQIPPALRARAVRAGQATREGARRAAPAVATASRRTARHGAYVRDGAGHVLRAGWRRVMLSDLAEAAREARAAGDLSAAADFEHKRREAANDRWKRIETAVKLSAKVLLSGAGTWVGVTTVVAVCGLIAQGLPGGTDWAGVWTEGYWAAHVATAEWTLWLASLWPWIGGAALVSTVYALHRMGLPESERLARAEVDDEEEAEGKDPVPGRDVVLRALRNLGIKDLTAAIDKGPRLRFPVPPHRDGPGYACQIELPEGRVTVDMVRKAKDVLASNLSRFPREVWPGEPDGKPGVLDLWVADQGALSRSIGPSPVTETDHQGDFFGAVPVGVTPRGDEVRYPLFESNLALAGKMGSGKSSLLISVVASMVLDPLVDIDVYVMADNADFDPFAPLLRTLRTGTGEDVATSALETLRELFSDMETRGQALREHGVRKNSRKIAAQDSRLRPRVVVIDECQALFAHGEHKDEARSLAKQIVSAGRKYGIACLFATPEPSTDSLPRQMMSIISHLACFAIGDQRSNDAILGTGAYKSGVDATSLRPKTETSKGDVGTAVCKGFTETPGPLRMYYIDEDEAAQIAERAQQVRSGQHSAAAEQSEPDEQRDLLEDLDQVLGHERVGITDVVSLLRDLAPHWQPYERLNGKQLKSQLKALGVQVPGPKGYLQIVPENVRDALAERRAKNDDQEPDEDE